MNNYTPYTDINIPDFKIGKRDMGRIHISEVVWPPKKIEIPDEESNFFGNPEIWGDNVHYEVENSLTRAAIAFVFVLLIIYIFRNKI